MQDDLGKGDLAVRAESNGEWGLGAVRLAADFRGALDVQKTGEGFDG
jgi:hypothetical protein